MEEGLVVAYGCGVEDLFELTLVDGGADGAGVLEGGRRRGGEGWFDFELGFGVGVGGRLFLLV